MADNEVNIVVNGEDKASPAINQVKEASKGVSGLFGELGKGLAVFELASGGFEKLAGAAEGFLGKASEVGGEVFKLQTIMGGTAEDASRMRFAFEEMGVSGASSEKGMRKFSQALAGIADTADGVTIPIGKQMKTMLHELGVEAEDSAGQNRSMSAVMADLADKFKDMPDGAEKTAVSLKLFGKAGADLIPLLNKGKEGMAEFAKESDKLGLTLDQKTLDSLKKQKLAMREMSSATDGLKLQIGVALTPVITFLAVKLAETTAFITANVIPVIKDVAGWIGDKLSPVFQVVSKDIGNFASVISGAFSGDLAGAADSFNKLPEPLQNLALTLADVKVKVTDFIAVFRADIAPVLQDVASKLADVLVPALQSLGDWLTSHMDIVTAFGTAAILGVVVPAFTAWAIAAGAAAIATIAAALPVIALIAVVGLLGVAIYEVIKHHDAIKDKILEVWGIVSDFMNAKLGFIVDIVRADFESLKVIVETAINVVKDVIAIAMDIIHGDWGKAWDDVKKLFSDVWDGIKALVAIRLEEMKNLLGDAWSFITQAAAAAWPALVSTIEAALGGMRDAVIYGLGAIGNFFAGLPGQITNALAGLSSQMFDIGVQVIQGLLNGLESMLGALASKIADIASSIKDGIAGALGVNSPSTVFHEIGTQLIAGLVNGIDASAGAATEAMVRLSKGLPGTISGGAAQTTSASGGGDASARSSSQIVQVNISGPVTVTNGDAGSMGDSVGWAIAQGMRARGVWA